MTAVSGRDDVQPPSVASISIPEGTRPSDEPTVDSPDDLPPALPTGVAALLWTGSDNFYFYGLCVGVPLLCLVIYVASCVSVFKYINRVRTNYGSMGGIRLHVLNAASSAVQGRDDDDDDDDDDVTPSWAFRILLCLWYYGTCACCYCVRRHFPGLIHPIDRLDRPKVI